MDLRILSTIGLQQALTFRGDYERVVDLARENLAALPAARAHEYFGQIAPASVYNRYWMILSLIPLGRFAEAAMHEAEALRLAEVTADRYTLGVVHLAASTLHLWKGDWVSARTRIDQGIAVFRDGQITFLLPRMVASAAWALAHVGASSEARDHVAEARQLLDDLSARGMSGMYGWPAVAVGRACLVLGWPDEARDLAHRALEFTRSKPGEAAEAFQLLGDIATHPDRFDAEGGEAHYRQALALAEPRGMRPLVAHCHLGLGKLYRRTGKPQQAQEHLITATTMYREMDMRFYLEQAEATMRDR